jgi:hypothetical protein
LKIPRSEKYYYSVDAYEFPKENKYSVPYADAVEINDLDYEEIIPAE